MKMGLKRACGYSTIKLQEKYLKLHPEKEEDQVFSATNT